MRRNRLVAAAVGLFMALSIQTLSAQTFLLQALPEAKATFGLRFMRPNFDGDSELSTLSGTYDLFVNVPVSSKLNLVGALPFTTVAFGGEDSESGIGDIYVGLQTRNHSSTASRMGLSVGVFLPTASEDKEMTNFFGILANYHELQRSLLNTLTLYGNLAYRSTQPGGALFGLEFGPQLFIPTKDTDDRQVELFAHYGLAGGFRLSNVAIFGEFMGLFIATEDFENFGDRFTHSIAFGAQVTDNAVRPGIFYQIPLDEDFKEFIDGILGIKVEISPR
ncbi:MAG: transporter [candidate division KSB1 bacterium]|nr:transporter [candidate division KSB1 bacterium]MDZ7300743.1 transporter [candidate division KSB1 bacterium]MDZ7309987.1 transporter [candidate division KSB1 bacterium]